MDTDQKIIFALVLLGAIGFVGFWGGIGYILLHFISKLW